MNSPHKFNEHIVNAMSAEPSIAQNEVEARRLEAEGHVSGHGGWRDHIVVSIGVGILLVFGGGFLWNLFR